jgi:GMP synthase-like glutamine amidotransferase
MKFLSVVQHTQSDWLGLIEDHFEGRQIRFSYFRPFASGGKLPDSEVVGDGLVLLGLGPWGTAGGHDVPSLEDEISLARTCLMLGKPVIGIGLGAQILSLAADGKTEASPLAFSTGHATRTRKDALNGFLPERFPNVVYMRDRPLPPDYAEILAVDEDGRPALFQIGANAFGFCGHPGVKLAMIEDLIMESDETPPEIAEELEKLRNLGPEIADALVAIMTGLIQLTALMKT